MESRKAIKASLTTFINPYSYKILRSHKNIKKIRDNFEIKYDGISLVKAHNLIFKQKIERESFDDTSLAPGVFREAQKNGSSVGIIGSSQETIAGAAQILSKKYGIFVKEYTHGFFSEEELPSIQKKFSSCDIVICSMGTPKQEVFLLDLKNLGWSGSGYTCGGYFDQLVSSGGEDYYPPLINTLNLRWAYRIYKEPRRLWRRYLIDYPLGIILFFIDSTKSHASNNNQ